MTKKLSLILAMLLCLNCIFSAASAYDSGWSHYKGPSAAEPTEEPVEIPTEEPVVEPPVTDPVVTAPSDEGTIADGLHNAEVGTKPQKPVDGPAPVTNIPSPDINIVPNPVASGEGELRTKSVTLDSITLYNEVDESTQQVLDMLSGTKISVASQGGDASRTIFELAMQGSPLFNLDVQSGTPLYISSNYFGGQTYMIYPEDEFAEKLITAFYNLMEKVSDEPTNLPDLDEVLAIVKSIRSGNTAFGPGQLSVNFEFSQEVDPTALMAPVMDVMSRFVSAEPTENISYRYTDFDPETLEFEWPAEAVLPEITQAASATTGMFFGEDIITFLDSLPQFLADNPELADALNQVIIQAMNQTNPASEIPEGTDVLGDMIKSLRESSQSLEDFYLNLKIDNDEYGSPVLITAEIGKPQDDVNSGLILTIMPVIKYPQSVIEIAGDAFQNDTTIPLFRLLSNSEEGNSSLNFRYADPNDTAIELAQYRTEHDNGSDQVAETTIYFDFSGMFGTINAVKTSVPNNYDGNDVFTQMTYEMSMQGEPMFAADITVEAVSSDALPALTPADAIHASDMTETDYDDLAGTIFMQLMMIVMNFM